ncbi:MAG: PDZ domain-containing protein, partial [Pontibacter sp.]|nr:PDZ domain-containing protein [Pontibacter sp.]
MTHHVDEAQGAFVAGVIPHSTAAALKLRSGDVILRINGEKVGGVADVVAKAKSFSTGDNVT